jgi:hypothetical protein
MNNTNQVTPSTNQVDPNQNPQSQPSVTPAQPTTASPEPTAAAPTPAANPQTNPTTAAPTMNQPTAQPSQNQPHPVSKMFDSILKTMSGGPIIVTDPATGQRREVQQSKGSMARAITAAALAGLFTPNQYRPGPFGGSVLDKGNTVAAAGQAGMQMRQQREQQAQKTLDDQQARKLFTIQNNAKLAQQAAAMAHQQHAVLADTVKTNEDKFMGPLAEFDASRPAGQPSIFQAKGQTSDQVLAGGHSLTDSNVFIDGTTTIINPQTHVAEDHPTYSVIRSTNADGSPITLKLPQEVTDELGKYSKPYEQAYKATGGNVLVPINNYMDAIHTYHTLNSVESFMNRVQKDVNPTGQKVSLAAAYKNDPTGYWQAINSAEQAIAAGNGRPGEDTEDNVLTKIAAAPSGSKLLDLVGTPQQVEDWKNGLISKRKLAQEGGIGDKAPATPEQNAAYLSALNKLPADQQGDFVKPPKAGWTQGQLEKEQNRLDARFDTNTKNAIQAGDPTQLAAQTRLSIGAGDLTSAKDIFTARSNVKEAYNLALQNKASELGLQPTHFNVEALKAKAAALDAYSAAGKVGQQLNAFKTFGEHVAGAKDANDAWARSGSPLFNKPLSWLAENATNDQSYQRFRDSVIAPAKEYMNFLNGNRAEHAEDIRAMESVLDSKSATPQTVYTALQTWAKTADDRAKALGETYRDTVGTTFPGLVSKATVDNLAKLGVKSQAAALSGTLPRAQSWVANLQPQMLVKGNPDDTAIGKKFFQAAGGDLDKAVEMAHEHGYIIPVGK